MSSLFRGVRRVPPGQVLELEGNQRLRPYWTWPDGVSENAASLARGEAGPELLRLLRAAVSQQPRPLACALSGGLDSGVLLALMAEEAPSPLAMTLADDFTAGQELAATRALAAHCGAALEVLTIREEELPDHLEATVLACEEPIWNGRAVARHLFFRAARQAGASALLSGVGADEVLWGNPAALLDLPRRRQAERLLAESVLTPEARATLSATGPDTQPVPKDVLLWSRAQVLSRLLPDSILPPECRTARAEGVALLLPYLSPAFAEFALHLPVVWQVSGLTGKRLLREAARGLVPDEICDAAKVPRLAPSGGNSPRARARWLALYDAWLSGVRLRELAVVREQSVRQLLDQHRHGSGADETHVLRDALLMRLVSIAVMKAKLGALEGAALSGEGPRDVGS